MKKNLTIIALNLAFFTAAQAQPVINNGNNMLPVGSTDSIAVVTSASTSPGSAGANITWDFSALMPTVAGSAKIVAPSATPYAATFPTATYAIELTPVGAPGSVYEYYNISSSKWDIVGSGYSVATPSGNYTPNNKTMIPFPFTYNQSVTDTFQKMSSSVSTMTVTYDGYGTLKTPYKTINNVIRVKRDFGGTDYFYDWFSVNPLVIVANYDNNTQKFTFMSTSTATSVNNVHDRTVATIYPNPAQSNVTIALSERPSGIATLLITDATGRLVKQMKVAGEQITFSCDGLNSGLYFYSIQDKNAAVAKGRFIVK